MPKHMSILYVGCKKSSTNQFVENLCPFILYWFFILFYFAMFSFWG
jgi:hypothetical protein